MFVNVAVMNEGHVYQRRTNRKYIQRRGSDISNYWLFKRVDVRGKYFDKKISSDMMIYVLVLMASFPIQGGDTHYFLC